MRGVCLLVVLSGCDGIFDLVHVDLPDAPATRDYDGDGVYATDNCAAIANPDQADTDGDGIGDACDPHPTELGDVIVDQELFHGATSQWMTLGAWLTADGAWQSPPATTGGTLAFPTRDLFRPALQVGFTIDAYDPQNLLRQLELHFDAPTSADCSVRYDPTVTTTSQLVLHVAGTMYVTRAITPDYELGTHYVVTYARALTSTCTILAQTDSRTDIAEQLTTAPTLILTRMQVTIDHVTLYQVVQ